MQYFLNGGRDERGVLKSDDSLALYGRLNVKRVLFIVYALVEEAWQQRWQDSGPMVEIPQMELKALTLYDTDPAAIAAALDWADFVYFPGGSQESLLKRIHALSTYELLNQKLASNTLKLLGGGSAGAMVMGGWCIIGHRTVNAVVAGLGYLPDYVIDSHFSERDRLPRLEAVLKDLPGISGLGLDEDTAALLSREGALQAVYGSGTVTVCGNTNKTYDQNHRFTS